ncbi:MAG: IS200/IS605 family transposase [Patescibacteria group bacterium]|nr:IS200/IS605 family transposase [Patescibacteria group bacterium]MDE2589978.1 IS200/IS605 family transposase [Patescibacteria group bacterium]
MGIIHTSHARYELWYHVAFSTKYRKHVFTDDKTKGEVEDMFREIALQYDMKIDKIQVMSDHVHMSLSAPPRIAPSRAVQILKSVGTKLLFKKYKFLKKYYWGGEVFVQGYFIRSIGPGLTKEQINKYIDEQSEEI